MRLTIYTAYRWSDPDFHDWTYRTESRVVKIEDSASVLWAVGYTDQINEQHVAEVLSNGEFHKRYSLECVRDKQGA